MENTNTQKTKTNAKQLIIFFGVILAIPLAYFLVIGGAFIVLYDTRITYTLDFTLAEYEDVLAKRGIDEFTQNHSASANYRTYSMRKDDIIVDITGPGFSGQGSNGFQDEKFDFAFWSSRVPFIKKSDEEMKEIVTSLLEAMENIDGQNLTAAKIEKTIFNRAVNPTASTNETIIEYQGRRTDK